MSECIKHWQDRHLHYWDEALKAKYTAPGKPYQVKEFNKIFQGYNAVSDIPSILFVDELLAAYPKAKVILTNRDVDRWLKSMDSTFYAVMRWRTMGVVAYLDPALLRPYWSLLYIVMDTWTGGNWKDQQALRQGFLDHYKHVRAAVPENRILEFKSEDGWEPLCSFLQKPIPTDVPYPHVNEGVGVVQLHAFLYWIRLAKALGRMATVGAPILVAIAATWWYLA
ncbi:MAG: hypothetical protein L6R38_005035 [Xanthoria sp. 2 TBL-2021]|nr:MAG: hypothetical protein L6R38_005035 [Xanthoria sp. 2 TBL-2021]